MPQPADALHRVSRRSQATRGSSAWLLSSSSGVEDGTELAEHLTSQLWELVHAG